MSHFLINKKILLLVKQDRFSQTCQDLWYVDGDDLSDHLRKADLRVERLSLDKKVECKLVELLYRHLERVQESGELVEPLRTIVGHPIINEAIELVDVGEAQLIEVLLTLQTLNRKDAEEQQGLHAEELFVSDL